MWSPSRACISRAPENRSNHDAPRPPALRISSGFSPGLHRLQALPSFSSFFLLSLSCCSLFPLLCCYLTVRPWTLLPLPWTPNVLACLEKHGKRRSFSNTDGKRLGLWGRLKRKSLALAHPSAGFVLFSALQEDPPSFCFSLNKP